MNKFYVYAYLRADGTSYYIGKGHDDRILQFHTRRNSSGLRPPPKERIQILKENLSEDDAFELEKFYISKYGRKDKGTGILRNLTDGGEGAVGRIHSEETKNKIGKANVKALKGNIPWNKGKKSYPMPENHPWKKRKDSGWKPWNAGIPISSDHVLLKYSNFKGNKFSEEERKKRYPKIKCPHCDKTGAKAPMSKWHFDNCRDKKHG